MAKTVNLEFQIGYHLAAPLGNIDSICMVLQTPHFRWCTKYVKLPFENCLDI